MQILAQWTNTYGSVFNWNIAGQNMLVITDPEEVSKLCSRDLNLPKSAPFYKGLNIVRPRHESFFVHKSNSQIHTFLHCLYDTQSLQQVLQVLAWMSCSAVDAVLAKQEAIICAHARVTSVCHAASSSQQHFGHSRFPRMEVPAKDDQSSVQSREHTQGQLNNNNNKNAFQLMVRDKSCLSKAVSFAFQYSAWL